MIFSNVCFDLEGHALLEPNALSLWHEECMNLGT